MKSLPACYCNTLQDKLKLHAMGESPAVVWEDEQGYIQSLSYDELYEKVLARAATIQMLAPNVGHGRRVGVCLPRTADYVISFLSIWFAGAVYVPIADNSLAHLNSDHKYKNDFEQRVRVLSPHLDIIITDAERIPILQTLTPVKLLNVAELVTEHVHTPMQRDLLAEAFVFCSSGTMGVPKIIAIPHEGIADRVSSVITELDITEKDCILQYTSFDFDPSLMEIFMALQFASPLIIAPESTRINPQNLPAFFEKLSALGMSLPNIAIIVPSMLKLIPPNTFPRFKSLMTTGENIVAKDLQSWFEANPNLRIFSGYGPTETTWGATLTEISRDPISVHISKPMQGIKLKLVPTDDGIQELLIGGNGQGIYIGEKADEQRESNWLEIKGEKYFNPHDSVVCEDGKLFFAGRVDDLIKYHGKWVNLAVIDEITEGFLGVEHATTVSIDGTSMVFVYIVIRNNHILNIAELHQYFRAHTGGELFPTFLQTPFLKFNRRGKRCRKLSDYRDCRLLSEAVHPDSLARIWTLALAEIDLEKVQAAFAEVGIEHFQNYFPKFAAKERFDELGGRSIKFPRLVNLLWKEYIGDAKRSQHFFRLGLLRHQSFQEMQEFIELYTLARQAFDPEQHSANEHYTCLWVNITWTMPDRLQNEFCELLELEIKASFSATFYYLILNCDSKSLSNNIHACFKRSAFVDDAFHLSSTEVVEEYCQQLVIRKILEQTPEIPSSRPSNINFPVTGRVTLLGSACGKTTALLHIHEQQKKAGKVVCYLSCRNLVDEENNLAKLLGLSARQWDILCRSTGLLGEITWLIDDIEWGIGNNKLSHLNRCFEQYNGVQHRIYAGRENVYCTAIQTPQCYGQIILLKPLAEVTIQEWLQAEMKRSLLPPAAFIKQIRIIIEEFKKKTYIRAETQAIWWANITQEELLQHPDRPPLHVTHYPCFSSLVRFLKLHDTRVYSIHDDYRAEFEERGSAFFDFAATLYAPVRRDIPRNGRILPRHVRYFPGESFLSPWIFFHSISGNCPDEYSMLAELIYALTRQGVYTIAIPERQKWHSLEEQVQSYLEMIEEFLTPGAPFFLLGWSYGGYLATKAAQLLEAQGKTVAVVVNLDAAPFFSYPNFPWEVHTQFIQDYLLRTPNSLTTAYLHTMSENVQYLRDDCQSPAARRPVLTKHYIFEAMLRPPHLQAIAYDTWSTVTPYVDYFQCEADHFKIFYDTEFRIQFMNIVERHREAADVRPLRTRLHEKALAFLTTQTELNQARPEYIEPEIEAKIYENFLENDNAASYLIIEGEPGTGKSRMMEHVAECVLRERTKQPWYPIIFPLRLFLQIRDVNTLLLRSGFSPSDFRQDIRFLFILDGVEESDLDLQTYPLRLSEFGHNSKAIVTVRKGFVVPAMQPRLVYQLSVLSDHLLSVWLKRCALPELHLTYSLNARRSDLLWLRTPLALSMMLKLKQAGHNIENIFDNEFSLYQSLDEFCFKENCPQNKAGKAAFRLYKETFALQTSVSANSIWNHPDFMTQSFKKSAQLLEQNGQLTYPHITWRDYYLASALIQTVLECRVTDSFPQDMLLFSQIQLTDLPKTRFLVNLLLGFWSQTDTATRFCMRNNLFIIALLPRRFNITASAKAATNAMVMLNIFKVSLAGLNLSETQLPNCDLSGMNVGGACFKNCDLTGTNFSSTALDGADFSGSVLANIELGFPKKILTANAFCYAPDGQFLVVDVEGTLIVYDGVHYEEQWRRKVSDHMLNQIVVSPHHHFACTSVAKEFIYVDASNPNKPTGWVLTDKDFIADIAFSPNGVEFALLYQNGIERYVQGGADPTWLPIRVPTERWLQWKSYELVYSPSGNELATVIHSELVVYNTVSEKRIIIHGLETNFDAILHPASGFDALLYHPSEPLLFVMSSSGIYCIETLTYTVTKRIGERIHTAGGGILLDVSRRELITYGSTWMRIGGSVCKFNVDEDNIGSEIDFFFQMYIKKMKLSPSGKQLAAKSTDFGSVYLMNVATEEVERELPYLMHGIAEIAYHPKELHFAVLTKFVKLHLWSPLQRTPISQIIRRPQRERFNFTITPLLSCFEFIIPNIYLVFYPHNRKCVSSKFGENKRESLAVRNDELQFVFNLKKDRGVYLKNVTEGSRELKVLEPNPEFLEIAYIPPQETKILVLTAAACYIFDASTAEIVYSVKIYDELQLTVNLNGECVVVRGPSTLTFIFLRDPISVQTVAIDNKYEIIESHPSRTEFAAIDECNIVIFTSSESAAYSALHHLTHAHKISSAKYRPHSDDLACITEGHELYIWNTQSGSLLMKITLAHGFTELSYAPNGAYFATWEFAEINSPSERARKFIPLIQVWDAQSMQPVDEISIFQPVRGFQWLKSIIQNSKNCSTYTVAFWEGTLDIKVYELVVNPDRSLCSTLIWSYLRPWILTGAQSLKQANTTSEPTRVPMVAPAVQNTPHLNILLKIGSYLCYRDYCNFVAAYSIPAEKCRNYKSRPIFEEVEWKRYSPTVGEQLQRMGFFALSRAADIHHLKLEHIPETSSSESDTYQSLMICEENGDVCGAVDVYFLDDCMRIARTP